MYQNCNMTVRIGLSGGKRITLQEAQGRLYAQGWDAENQSIAVTLTREQECNKP
jgi:YD repeat-containing protein